MIEDLQIATPSTTSVGNTPTGFSFRYHSDKFSFAGRSTNLATYSMAFSASTMRTFCDAGDTG